MRDHRFRHGQARRSGHTPEYDIYNTAKGRCIYRRNKSFKNYGGRGIQFRFKSFAQFLKAVGKRPSRKHVLDRIDNDGHYEPGNVRWATRSQSVKNRRSTKRMHEASRKNMLHAQSLRWR